MATGLKAMIPAITTVTLRTLRRFCFIFDMRCSLPRSRWDFDLECLGQKADVPVFVPVRTSRCGWNMSGRQFCMPDIRFFTSDYRVGVAIPEPEKSTHFCDGSA